MAAVELRKRVAQNSGDLWLQVAQNDREQIKARMPEFILTEQKLVDPLLLSHFSSLPTHSPANSSEILLRVSSRPSPASKSLTVHGLNSSLTFTKHVFRPKSHTAKSASTFSSPFSRTSLRVSRSTLRSSSNSLRPCCRTQRVPRFASRPLGVCSLQIVFLRHADRGSGRLVPSRNISMARTRPKS